MLLQTIFSILQDKVKPVVRPDIVKAGKVLMCQAENAVHRYFTLFVVKPECPDEKLATGYVILVNPCAGNFGAFDWIIHNRSRVTIKSAITGL
ncbi:hypothetical protein RRC335 [Methanocella arvoryzae MRE50]|uniref:Uncharacterized protein n=1 Tax=Methanocella arvoryzae (strain DSM 22066 / NBRC 105507 / MRE50) TaxID=351160 RepID=Q0W0N7_METAR|nr:hypothetical protein RRC335 [Methanocella arvoryzae MRE50]